jgi:circadian clock protein KaiC
MNAPPAPSSLNKCPTGITGFDDVTFGGLPRGRPTLLVGGAGSGKTLFGIQFLVNGVRDYQEHGVLLSFEESGDDLSANVHSLGIDLPAYAAAGQLAVKNVEWEGVAESGNFDLEPLFIRLGAAIDAVHAQRVVLDGIENLFTALNSERLLRAELQRLFRWLKARRVTAVITGERGQKTITRHGLEEYISDCVVVLDQRVERQIATRHLRVLKYRGSAHGPDEYPFLIDLEGLNVMPITSIGLDKVTVTEERISTGVASLDAMLGEQGFIRGSTVLVSGESGTGKSTLAAHLANAACRRGEACLYVAMEEAPTQIMRNMRSVGIDLQPWLDSGLLHFHAVRPTRFGLETHLAYLHRLCQEFKPQVVLMDPISAFDTSPEMREQVRVMLMRAVDLFKQAGITAMFTNLTHGDDGVAQFNGGLSSLMDTWLLLRNIEQAGERTRTLYIMKSRGMRHSNQVREFILSESGLALVDVMIGPDGQVLTGTARAQELERQRAQELAVKDDVTRRKSELARKKQVMEARIAALQAEFDSECQALETALTVQADAANAGRQASASLAKRRS